MSDEELIAELNAELRDRDPLAILRKQIRNRTLNEIEQQLDNAVSDFGDSIHKKEMRRIIADMKEE